MIWRLLERRCRSAARAVAGAGRSAWRHALHPRPRRPKPLRSGVSGVILAFQPGGLGKLVQSLPAFDDLARAHPAAKLVAVVRAGLADLAKGSGSIATVLEVRERQDASSLASRLSVLGASLLVDFSLDGNLLAPKAAALVGVPARVGLGGGGREVLLTHFLRPGACGPSISETLSSLVAAAGGSPSGRKPSLTVPADATREAEVMLRSAGAGAGGLRIAIHPGAGLPSRRWPAERFSAAARSILAKRGGKAIVVIGPGEEPLAKRIKQDLGQDGIVIPPGDLRTLAAVTSRCNLLLANDSGPRHLAGALNVPTVSLIGPTDPRSSWPEHVHQAVLRREEVPCSPCSRSRCGPHDCLSGIGPEEVAARALDLIDPLECVERAARAEASRRPALYLVRSRDEEEKPAAEGQLVGAH